MPDTTAAPSDLREQLFQKLYAAGHPCGSPFGPIVVDLDDALDIFMAATTDRGEGKHQPLRDLPGAESREDSSSVETARRYKRERDHARAAGEVLQREVARLRAELAEVRAGNDAPAVER